MESERWTHGGKSDAPRNLGKDFQVNYGDIRDFASNRVSLSDDGWCFKDKNGTLHGGFSSRLRAIQALRQLDE